MTLEELGIRVRWRGGAEIIPIKILLESNELNFISDDLGNCEWTQLNNPDLEWWIDRETGEEGL